MVIIRLPILRFINSASFQNFHFTKTSACYVLVFSDVWLTIIEYPVQFDCLIRLFYSFTARSHASAVYTMALCLSATKRHRINGASACLYGTEAILHWNEIAQIYLQKYRHFPL